MVIGITRQRAAGSPERLADKLTIRIFLGEIPAGSALPAERKLAADLGVDRTTLRMALKQLQRMNLIVIRHGSGIFVNDFREHGGLDVLATLFALKELPLASSFIVEALDFWLDVFSTIGAKTLVRASDAELAALIATLDHAVASRGETLAKIVFDLTDEVARLSGSVILRMLNNSTHSLRERIIRILVKTSDCRPSLQKMREALRAIGPKRPAEEDGRRVLHGLLRELTAELRKTLAAKGE